MGENKMHKLKNDKTVVIRRSKPEDAEKIIELVNKVAGETDYLTFGQGGFCISVEEEKKIIKNSLEINNQLFVVAEIDGKIVGNLTFIGGKRERIAHVGEFGVGLLKEYWGWGIGKALIDYLIQWAKETGVVRKINLRVREDNTRAINLYENMGFEKEGILKRDMYVKGKFYDSICMGMCID